VKETLSSSKGVEEVSRSASPRDDTVATADSSSEAAAETVITEVHERDELAAIGSLIRKLRQSRGLSLRELGELTGLSTGFLSLVERSRSSLTLTSLSAVAKGLGVDMGYFFPRSQGDNQDHPLPHVTRARGKVPVSVESSERTYRMLSGRSRDKVLDPLLVTVHPTETREDMYTHEGEEFCYVLNGELIYIVNGIEYRLRPGDTIHVKSTVPHAIHNDTDEPVEAIWVLSPPLLQ
jgi:transcriptional regulator with XRE-family HTH domain